MPEKRRSYSKLARLRGALRRVVKIAGVEHVITIDDAGVTVRRLYGRDPIGRLEWAAVRDYCCQLTLFSEESRS